jgi:transcriptional regulator with XRE-family HTH domain
MSAPDPTVLSDRIRAERERLGWSMSEAANRLGWSHSTYKQLELRPNPTVRTLGALAEAGFRMAAILPELFTRSNRRRPAP